MKKGWLECNIFYPCPNSYLYLHHPTKRAGMARFQAPDLIKTSSVGSGMRYGRWCDDPIPRFVERKRRALAKVFFFLFFSFSRSVL